MARVTLGNIPVNGLRNAVPDPVDIRTAHDAKGSEAEHVIIPKVSKVGGYPSMKPDPWLEPIKQPPEIYDDAGVTYVQSAACLQF